MTIKQKIKQGKELKLKEAVFLASITDFLAQHLIDENIYKYENKQLLLTMTTKELEKNKDLYLLVKVFENIMDLLDIFKSQKPINTELLKIQTDKLFKSFLFNAQCTTLGVAFEIMEIYNKTFLEPKMQIKDKVLKKMFLAHLKAKIESKVLENNKKFAQIITTKIKEICKGV